MLFRKKKHFSYERNEREEEMQKFYANREMCQTEEKRGERKIGKKVGERIRKKDNKLKKIKKKN